VSVWDIKLEREEVIFGNALVSLYKIKSDTAVAQREQEHTHSYYELHLMLRHGHTYTIGGKTVPVKPGEMVIICPGTVHRSVPLQQCDNVAVLAVSVKQQTSGKNLFGSLIQRLNASTAVAIPLSRMLADRIAGYGIHSPRTGIRDTLHKKLAACEILVGIFDAIGCGEEDCTGAAEVDFDMMLETLVHNSGVSLGEIAERLGYSPRQTSRIIQKRYGKTFTQLRKENE